MGGALFRAPRPVRLVVAALAAVVGSSCGDLPAGPDPGAVSLTILAGDGQEGLEARPLLFPVVVQVIDASGQPVSGEVVSGDVLSGEGRLHLGVGRTDPEGRLEVTWTLGPASEPDQRARIRAGTVEATVRATSLPESAGDVVVVRGALGPLKGVAVVVEDRFLPAFSLEDVLVADTVIRLQPRRDGSQVVLVFPWDNPPERVVAAWTPGVDTVFVELRPPVPVDLVVEVFAGPLEEKMVEVERDLAALEEVIHREGLGIRLARVDVLDRTGGAEVSVSGPAACASAPLPPRPFVSVNYVHRIENFWGYACSVGLVFMSDERLDTAPFLFPHEVGHVLGLGHVGLGLMNPNARSGTLTEGEVYLVHAAPGSYLNRAPDIVPQEDRFLCGNSVVACLPVDFELAGEPRSRSPSPPRLSSP